MFRSFYLGFVLWVWGIGWVTSVYAEVVRLSDRNEYFMEIALGSEYAESFSIARILKWREPVRIWVKGELPDLMEKELVVIMAEINALVGRPLIKKARDSNTANLVLYWGTPEWYLEIDPEAEQMLEENDGIFRVQIDARYFIRSGRVFLNAERLYFEFDQRHFLREELTQSLGLMQDSSRYEDSIFYGERSKVTAYNEMDKYLIRVLYDKRIRPKMPLKALTEVLQAIEAEMEETKTTSAKSSEEGLIEK